MLARIKRNTIDVLYSKAYIRSKVSCEYSGDFSTLSYVFSYVYPFHILFSPISLLPKDFYNSHATVLIVLSY